LIWDNWLYVNRKIEYQNCFHVEYQERADQRGNITEELRRVIESHHVRSPDWERLLGTLGFPLLAEALRRSNTILPARTTQLNDDGESEKQELTTRKGNFLEVLAAEYINTQMNFEVPIRRLRYNPNRNQSMKGDDVLGFRFPQVHGSNAVLVGESKYRGRATPSVVRDATEEAYRSLSLSHRSYPVSMDFVATILESEEQQERSQWVRQIRAQLQSGKIPVERHYLLLLGTLGRPTDPFCWLKEQPHVVANLTCVNIVFAPGIHTWLDQLFSGE